MQSEEFNMKRIFACIFALALSAGLFAEGVSIKDLASRARSSNPDIVKSERAVESAKRDLTDKITVENSSISVSGGYSAAEGSANVSSSELTKGFIGEASLTLPVLSQLSIGGSVARAADGDVSGDLSLSVSPFAADPDTYTPQKAYQNALIHDFYLRQQTYYDAEQAALSLLVADIEREVARDTAAVEQKTYDMMKEKMALGEAALSEVQDQLTTLSSANKDLYNAEVTYGTAWKNLQLMFEGGEEIIAKQLSLDELLSYIDERKTYIDSTESAVPSSETLETLRAELAALEAEMKATPLYRPDLSINASAGLPSASYSISVGLKFSPSEIKSNEREDLKGAIADVFIDIQTETLDLALQKKMLRKNITIAEEAFSYAKLTKEKAERSLRESELLFEQGEYTELELESERLSVKSADADLFGVAADLYKAQADYLALFAGK
jgi:outer membrane protein TolC